MIYPQLSTLVDYRNNDYEVVAIEYDIYTKECKYHLKKDNEKIIVDVKDLGCNYKYRNFENKR